MRSEDQTDKALLETALGGDAQAFGTLMGRYQRPLFCYARGFLGSDQEAADAVRRFVATGSAARPD